MTSAARTPILLAHIKMRYRPNHDSCPSTATADAATGRKNDRQPPRGRCPASHPPRTRRDWFCHAGRNQGQPRHIPYRCGDYLRIGMVFLDALDVIVQGIETRRGQEPGLPHAAAKQLANPAAGNVIRSRGPSRASPTGVPNPLLKQTGDGVEVTAPLQRRNASSRHGVPRIRGSRPEVRRELIRVCPVRDRRDCLQRINRPPTPVVCVFQANQSRANRVNIIWTDLAVEI